MTPAYRVPRPISMICGLTTQFASQFVVRGFAHSGLRPARFACHSPPSAPRWGELLAARQGCRRAGFALRLLPSPSAWGRSSRVKAKPFGWPTASLDTASTQVREIANTPIKITLFFERAHLKNRSGHLKKAQHFDRPTISVGQGQGHERKPQRSAGRRPSTERVSTWAKPNP